MILYIDETENTEYFIVTGLLMHSKEVADRAYARFKKQAQNAAIPSNKKARLFTEFKSILLDSDYKVIKNQMLTTIVSEEPSILYSCFIKKGKKFSQDHKEETYLTLVSKIVSSIDTEVSVIYDRFRKPDFEQKIDERIQNYSHVNYVKGEDSQLECGLQFVDNVCSVIRLHMSGQDEYEFYKIIEKYVIEL